jgi:hypothetical protein
MLAAGAALSTPVLATPTVTLGTSLLSPQPLGTTITLTATGNDTDAGTISYKYEIGSSKGSTLSMVRDFSVDPTFVFTPTQHETTFQFKVTARNNTTLQTGTFVFSPFKFTSLVVGNQAVVTATANPMVALFSSPPCVSGGVAMRVSVTRIGSPAPFYTSWKNCVSNQTLNFVVAGMRAATNYSMKSETWNGSSIIKGTALSFTTGTPSITFPNVTLTIPPTNSDSLTERFVLMSTIQPFPMAVDLNGSPVWYYLDPSGKAPTLTRPIAGGTLLLQANGANSAGSAVTSGQILREIDLAGNTIRETNATRVSEQVQAMSGLTSNCTLGGTDCVVGAFHHEALQIPNGHTLVLSDEEKIFTDGTQGSSPTNPVDIIGDIVIDLDTNWQVAGYWRAFDHLDPNRAAVLGETCVNGAGGCPPITLVSGTAQDWLHGNALFYASDGSVLFSMRHQDWIVKIDYANGSGTGNIVWTLGKDGDFTINSTDPYPWFSHQHDPGFVLGGTTILALFDNGNTRVSPPPIGLGSGDSRGYVLTVDQTHKVVTPILLADLGVYSFALGTSELLANGDYHFEAGIINPPPPFSEAIEVFPNGTLGMTQKISTITYRTFRMVNLYTPPSKD